MRLKNIVEDNPHILLKDKLKDLYKVLEMYEKNKKRNQSLENFILKMENGNDK